MGKAFVYTRDSSQKGPSEVVFVLDLRELSTYIFPNLFGFPVLEIGWERRRMEKIDHLKKVSLLLEVESQTTPLEFVFGIGSEGLSPIEFELAEKKEGDTVALQLSGGDVADTFQHLMIPALGSLEGRQSFVVKVHVKHVRPADQKEVIKAMAEIASCGDHCCGH
jgi:hypothetical protein